MKTRLYHSAEQIPENGWDALASSVYETRRWFLASERYWKATRFSYFAAYRGGELRAVLPVYDRAADLYIGPSELLFRSSTRIGDALDYAIVGSPLAFASGAIGDESCLARLLVDAESYFRDARADVIAFPFSRKPVRLPGFVVTPSLIDFDLRLPGIHFDDYLAKLPGNRRRKIRREIRAAASLRFEDVDLAGHERVVADFRRLSAARHGKDADLDFRFYESVAANMGGRSRALLVSSNEDGRIIGASSYFEFGGALWLFHGGCFRERFAYFNLAYYELIRTAYERGNRRINYRPGSDAVKMLRGCAPVRTVACFKPISARGRVAVRVLSPVLRSQRRIKRRVRKTIGSALPGAFSASVHSSGPR
jgi:hypothetical protein